MSSDEAWPRLTLKAAGVSLIDCDHRTPAAQEGGGFPYIAIPQLRDGHIVLDGARRISEADYLEWTKKLSPQADDVIVVRRCNSGDSAHVPAGMKCAIGQNLVVLRADGKKVLPPYLRWLVRGAEWWDEVSKYINVGAVFDSLRCRDIPLFELPVPPLHEQEQISVVLAALDDRITLLHETNATLEAIAQALFKSWFVDFDPVRAKMEGRAPEGMDETTAALFPDALEETELGLVPRGWRVMPFLEACDLQGGAQPPASTFVDSPRGGFVRLLQIRDFSTDAHKTYIPDTAKLKKATEDDILLGRYGSASGDKAKDSLGRVCRGLSGAYNVALMKLVPLQVGREFALQLVNDPRFYTYLQGVSSKAVQSGFSKSELGQYKVVVPPKELCDAFEDLGLAFWSRLKHGVSRQRELAELRDTLLPRLISGQLRLPEAQAQLEDALA